MCQEENKKEEVKEKARGIKNFDPEKQQWYKYKIEVRPTMKEQVYLLS